jgi:7,8-dihydropterin-6-yl-methyl-4-(beta-D-ribofuranosyl)aminobenzene 5'-phosphate synthase
MAGWILKRGWRGGHRWEIGFRRSVCLAWSMRQFLCWLGWSLVLAAVAPGADLAVAGRGRVKELKITILSTMLADGDELGEWGFAALVEADGHRILFDTGARTDVVLQNAQSLKIDLTTVPEVILSHWHNDHIGGFLRLRDSVRAKAPTALARTHVAEGMFLSRRATPPHVEINPMLRLKPDYEKTGGAFVSHAGPVQLHPGIWLTGPVPRRHPERNWSGSVSVTTPAGAIEDTVPDDMSLIVDTEHGLVVLTGCGHAGVINIVEHARDFIRPARLHALIGGIHLFNASETSLAWTEDKLRSVGIDNLIGAHCTGIETVYRFRQNLGLDRAHAVVGAVGAGFELGRGINPREIAK